MSPVKDPLLFFACRAERSRHEWLTGGKQLIDIAQFFGLEISPYTIKAWPTPTPPLVLEKLVAENASLQKEIGIIRKKLASIEERIPEEKVVVLREISKEEAKQEIRDLFADGRTLYYSDIAEELQLDLKFVVELCHELESTGEIEEGASTCAI